MRRGKEQEKGSGMNGTYLKDTRLDVTYQKADSSDTVELPNNHLSPEEPA